MNHHRMKSMRAPARGKLLAALIAALFGLLATTAAFAQSTVGVNSWLLSGASNQGKNCVDLDGTYADSGTTWTEFKLEGDDLASGTYTDGTLSVTTVVNNTASPHQFNFTSNIGIDSIVVKNGNDGAFFYVYDGLTSPSDGATNTADGTNRDIEETADGNLTTPVNGAKQISHISFCYDVEQAPLTGKLEVIKNLEPSDDPGLFDLQINGVTFADEASDGDSTDEQIVNTGDHTVGETADDETDLADYSSSIECVDDNGNGQVVASSDDAGPLDVTVSADDDIVCTITNTRNTYNIRYIKYNDLDQDGTNNEINASGPPSGNALVGWEFTAYDADGNVAAQGITSVENAGANGDLGIRATLSNLNSGETYTICETQQPGWINTQPGTINGTYGEPCETVTITSSGNNFTRYFGNYMEEPETGSLTIVKQAIPDSGEDFNFTLTGPNTNESFTLDDDNDTDGTNPDRETFVLDPGVYDVTETIPFNVLFALTDITCEGTTATVEDDDGVQVSVEAGDEITCTFTNEENGSIEVIKQATPADGTNFDFNLSGGPDNINENFTLDVGDDGDNLPSNRTRLDLPPGDYDLTEIVPQGWTLDGIDCGNATTSDITDGVTITLAQGEDVSCTFTNSEDPETGTITIIKSATPEDDTVFSFTSEIPGGAAFTLQDPSDNTVTFTDVPSGTYNVTEIVPVGWDLVSIDCTPLPSNNTGAINGINIVLEAGEDVVCTFNNVEEPEPETGTIIIVKDTVPDNGQDFVFETSGDPITPTFTLDDASPDDNDGITNTHTFADIPLESYTFTEVENAEYETTISCEREVEADSTVTINGNEVTIDLAADETVTCTFTNDFRPDIRVIKYNDLNRNGEDDEVSTDPNNPSGNTLAGWTFNLYDSNENLVEFGVTTVENAGSGDLGVRYSFRNLNNGETYTICESEMNGWVNTEPGANSAPDPEVLGRPCKQITAPDGENQTFTNVFFGNYREQGTLIIEKETNVETDQKFEFEGDFEFNLMSGGSVEFSVDPGEYSIAEIVPEGWDLEDISCETSFEEEVPGEVGNVDLDNQEVTVFVGDEETVTCTFFNANRMGTIIIEKMTDVETDEEFEFEGDFEFNLQDGERIEFDVEAGEYEITEVLPDGWELDEITCFPIAETIEIFPLDFPGFTELPIPTAPSSEVAEVDDETVTIFVNPDETILCTFFNERETGSITIIKEVVSVDTSGGEGDFSNAEFDFDGDLPDFDLKVGDSITFDNVPTGEYDVIEDVPANWRLASVECSGGDVDERDNGVVIDLDDGDDVVCTFTNEPNCVNPAADLSAVINRDASMSLVTNDSTAECSWTVGMASYEKYDEIIDNQSLFDYVDNVLVGPGETVKLTVELPACAVQVDVFYGPVLFSLDGQRYGERLLAARHMPGNGYCEREVDSSSISGFVARDGEGMAGVTVTLTSLEAAADGRAANTMGSYAFDSVFLQTVTDADGYYEFTELAVGRYKVEIAGDALVGLHIEQTVSVVDLTEGNGNSVSFATYQASPTAVTLSTMSSTTSADGWLILTLILSLLTFGILSTQYLRTKPRS